MGGVQPKVSSKDVYAILREYLAPSVKQAGFKRLKMGQLGWTRPERTGHLSLWFQCDARGWFDDFGSRFTLEFQLAARVEAGAGGWDQRLRFARLVTPQELETIRVTNNNILETLPTPSANNPVNALPGEMRQWFVSGYRPSLEPYHPNHDVWLHYFARPDVELWASFIKDRVLRMISDFPGQLAIDT